MSKALGKAPPRITLNYKVVGATVKTHIFTAREIRGLHISGATLQDAFDKAFAGLSVHVSEMYGTEVRYTPEVDFSAFERHLQEQNKHQIHAKIAEKVNA